MPGEASSTGPERLPEQGLARQRSGYWVPWNRPPAATSAPPGGAARSGPARRPARAVDFLAGAAAPGAAAPAPPPPAPPAGDGPQLAILKSLLPSADCDV